MTYERVCVCVLAPQDELANPVPSHLGVNSRLLRHHWSPRALTFVSARKLEKLAMTKNASKKPITATMNSNAESRVPFSVAQLECPPALAMN